MKNLLPTIIFHVLPVLISHYVGYKLMGVVLKTLTKLFKAK